MLLSDTHINHILPTLIAYLQGLFEARAELRPFLLSATERLKDLIFLDSALYSTVRTTIERSYENLNNAAPEVN
jgi:alpha-glucan,water dikinase